MTVEKEREAFERWYVEKFRGTLLKGRKSPVRLGSTGDYLADRAKNTWDAWQARAERSKPYMTKDQIAEFLSRFSPHPGHIPVDGKMVGPTDTEMLDWIENNARIDPDMSGNHTYWPTSFGKQIRGRNLRDAITKRMRGEE